MADLNTIKQIASSRRRPGMTRKEYLDYHFQVHGALSDAIDDVDLKPERYTQTHIFDSAYGARPSGPRNANHGWMARDDVTELYFRDWDHVGKCMGSQYVRERVGPDAVNFADSETAMILLAHEHVVSLNARPAQETVGSSRDDSSTRVVAMLFIARSDGGADGNDLHLPLTAMLSESLGLHASDEVSELAVNVGFASEKLDPVRYFGGVGMPRYALMFKMAMRNAASVSAVRKAQADLVAKTGDVVDWNNSYILFGLEALVCDSKTGVPFDRKRQPLMPGLV